MTHLHPGIQRAITYFLNCNQPWIFCETSKFIHNVSDRVDKEVVKDVRTSLTYQHRVVFVTRIDNVPCCLIWVVSSIYFSSISNSFSLIHYTSVSFLRCTIKLPQPSFCFSVLTCFESIIYRLNHSSQPFQYRRVPTFIL